MGYTFGDGPTATARILSSILSREPGPDITSTQGQPTIIFNHILVNIYSLSMSYPAPQQLFPLPVWRPSAPEPCLIYER
jgi:hypothetical protein